MNSRTHLKNGGVAPRAARRPPGKARRPRIPGVFEEGATRPGGMHRRPNAVPIFEMGSNVLRVTVTVLAIASPLGAQNSPTYIQFSPAPVKGALYKPDSGPAPHVA